MEEYKNKDYLQEINRYQDSLFPIGIYIVTKNGIEPDGRGYQDLHWHEELQFTMVLEGRLKMKVNAKEYSVKKGEAIYINRNLLHETTELTDDGKYISLNFPDRMLSFFTGSRMEEQDVMPFTMNALFTAYVLKPECVWQNQMLQLLTDTMDIFLSGGQKNQEYTISVNLVSAWAIFTRHVRDELKRPSQGYIRKQKRVQSLLMYIHKYYMDELTLDSLASSVNVSVGECCRCFRQLVGISPNKYLLKYRILRGMELLRTTELSVTEVALAVGFNDVSHFIHYFKMIEHRTPNEYRKKC